MGRWGGNYGGYRGRRTLTDVLRIIAIVLAVAVALVLAGLFVAQDYLVYTDEGLRLELPFFQTEEEGDGSKTLDPGSITVREESGQSAASGQQETIKAIQLPIEALLDGTWEELLAQADANALILEMKGEAGTLAWQSEQDLAIQAGANGSPEVNEALKQLEKAEVYTIARVCCFRDDRIPYYNISLALRTSGGNWRDEKGLRWLSPASQPAQDYLTALCGELAELGFDEVLLEAFTFPTEGNLERIVPGERYDSTQFTQQVESFLQQTKQVLNPHGTALSLLVQGTAVPEEGDAGGLTLSLLEQVPDSLWLQGPDGASQLEKQLEQSGQTGPACGKIVEELDQQKAGSQAVLLPATSE